MTSCFFLAWGLKENSGSFVPATLYGRDNPFTNVRLAQTSQQRLWAHQDSPAPLGVSPMTHAPLPQRKGS